MPESKSNRIGYLDAGRLNRAIAYDNGYKGYFLYLFITYIFKTLINKKNNPYNPYCCKKSGPDLTNSLFSFAKAARGKGEVAGGAPSLVKGRAVGYEARPLP
jgi:hypothetical protein